jgi:hypothetical protein
MTVANTLDVAARLAAGRPTVDDVEEYVAACRQLGYQHRDLTVHAAQVRDWYDGEDGLDLRALDVDHAALSAAASGAEDAARMQNDLMSELSAAWSGQGAAEAREFVWRSCQAGRAVSVAVRAAADAMAALRDALWHAVDTKVLATEAIDGRQRAQRAEWLAAAKTVTSGGGDLATASELIELKVKPFVNLDVGSDWVAAMRSAVASVNAAYDAAIADTTAMPPAVFGVPRELGPRAEPSGQPRAPSHGEPSAAAVQTSPAAVAAPAPGPASQAFGPPPVTAPPLAAPPLTEAAPMPPALPSAAPSMPSSSGDLGAGTSMLGSGISGFGQQLADLIGSLVGSADEGLPDDAEATDESEPDEPDVEPDAEAHEQAADAEVVGEPTEAVEELTAESPPIPEPTPAPAPLPSEPPAPQALPEAVAVDVAPTPCEIAADELPQVGE